MFITNQEEEHQEDQHIPDLVEVNRFMINPLQCNGSEISRQPTKHRCETNTTVGSF